jgi:hypothetical protein
LQWPKGGARPGSPSALHASHAARQLAGDGSVVSGNRKTAFEFANGKPIELLAGSNLLYLLKEHANIDAKIVMPKD